MTRTVVIGTGNDFRGDDAAGLEVARRLRPRLPPTIEVIELDGDPAALIEAWTGAATAWVIDAICSDEPPGTVHRLDIGPDGPPVPNNCHRKSSHVLGLGEAVALARALDRLPGHLVLIGITGMSFGLGAALSDPVRTSTHSVADGLAATLRTY